MKIKALKKSVSLILTLAMVLSASYAISNFSAYATERKNYIIGGDFEDGENSLQYYEYTASSKNPIEIVEYQFDNGSATNKAAKLARPASGGDEYGNALSYNLKKLNLKPGAYTLTFDADVTSSNGNSYAFYYGVYNGTYDYSGRFYTNNAPCIGFYRLFGKSGGYNSGYVCYSLPAFYNGKHIAAIAISGT